MAWQCPYQHVSYATWRLKLIRALYHNEIESFTPRSPFESLRRKRYYGTSPPRQEDVSSQSPDPTFLKPDPSIESATKQTKRINPFSSDGIGRMQDVLAEVKQLRKKAERRSPRGKNSRIHPTLVYESPVKRKMEKSHLKTHKRQPTQEEKTTLVDNVWARMLVSPVRACFSSGTRLPAALLSDWSVVKEPTSDSVYLMPTQLADLDSLEEKMAAEMYKETWKHEANAWRAAAKARRAASEENQDVDPLDQDSHIEYVKPSRKPSTGHGPADTRIFMYINYLRYLTATLSKQQPPTSSQKNGPVTFPGARLIPPRSRENFGIATHYERNKMQVALAMGQIEKPPPDSDNFHLQKLQWQPDVDDRLTRILQKRVVIALRETARVLNDSRRKQQERRVLSLPIPKMGEFSIIKRHSYPEALRGWQGREAANHQEADSDAADDLPHLEELVEAPGGQVDEEIQPPPSWLAGSILLHIGKGDIDKLLIPEANPSKTSQQLPPLPSNSLIPAMVPVGGAYRIPVFSLHRFFTRSDDVQDIPHQAISDLTEIADIINTCASFNLVWPPVMPTSPLYSPFTWSEPQIPENFLILIKPFPGAQKTLIEEIWRLWRYVGGRRFGKEPSLDPLALDSGPDLEGFKDDVLDREDDAVQSTKTEDLTRRAGHSGNRSSFGLTMPSKQFKNWLNNRYPTATEMSERKS
jgi:hypothetical protein